MSDRMPSLREATRPRLREAMLGVLELGGAPDDAVARKDRKADCHRDGDAREVLAALRARNKKKKKAFREVRI